jgi:hypothetical protein
VLVPTSQALMAETPSGTKGRSVRTAEGFHTHDSRGTLLRRADAKSAERGSLVMFSSRWIPIGRWTAVVALVAACSSTQTQGIIVEDPARGTAVADGDTQFADTGLVDWVSYADGVFVVTVAGELRHEIPADVVEHGEGYVARTIEVQVEAVLWQPNHSRAEVVSGDTLEMLVFGWVLKGNRLIAMADRNSPRLEVGGRYVMPLVQFERGLAPLTAESPLPVADSAIAAADVDAWHAESPARDELAGKSFGEMATVLMTTAPDPVAARYFHLPPEARIRAVSSENNRAEAEPSPATP